jgi:hypothetical protein
VFGRLRQIFGRDAKLKSAFSKVSIELDDHREAINANTNEMSALYEHICKLESTIEKLTERIDEISMFHVKKTECPESQDFSIVTPTKHEKEAFLALYSANDRNSSLKDLARRIGRTIEQTHMLFSNLIGKGVPVKIYSVDEEKFVYLDPEFKSLQTRHNVMSINEGIAKEVMH